VVGNRCSHEWRRSFLGVESAAIDNDNTLCPPRLEATVAAKYAGTIGLGQLPPEVVINGARSAPGTDFPASGPAAQPEVIARNFLSQHGKLFGIISPSVDFKLRKKNSGKGRHSIRLTQTYAGIPIFGGEIVVQVNDGGGIEYISGNFERDTREFDEQRVLIRPKLTAAEAQNAARANYEPQAKGQDMTTTRPELTLFVPALLKLQGAKRLTWKMEVRSADGETVAKQVFIDAHSGALVQEISLIHEALDRKIYDANFSPVATGSLVRTEGEGPVGIADADDAYDFLGDVYDFYYSNFQRDGIFNDGAPLVGLVRYLHGFGGNASWDGSAKEMRFDPGFVVDDITGHELTHGVVEAESGLIYLNQSGAINESLADIFWRVRGFGKRPWER
jgi:Zn-dependent metalloprotease